MEENAKSNYTFNWVMCLVIPVLQAVQIKHFMANNLTPYYTHYSLLYYTN